MTNNERWTVYERESVYVYVHEWAWDRSIGGGGAGDAVAMINMINNRANMDRLAKEDWTGL